MSMGRRLGEIMMDFKCHARNLGNWSRWKDVSRGMTKSALHFIEGYTVWWVEDRSEGKRKKWGDQFGDHCCSPD